jgi:hypothetical protein
MGKGTKWRNIAQEWCESAKRSSSLRAASVIGNALKLLIELFFAIIERFMDTNINSSIDPPAPPAVLGGVELYDTIMGQIEPELLSSNLPFSADKFQDEDLEQRAERARRYQAAFDEYDRRFAQYCDTWNEELHSYKRQAVAYIEAAAQTNDDAQLSSIESSLAADL